MPVYDPANPTYDTATGTFRAGRLFPEDLNNLVRDLTALIAAGGGAVPAAGTGLVDDTGGYLTDDAGDRLIEG